MTEMEAVKLRKLSNKDHHTKDVINDDSIVIVSMHTLTDPNIRKCKTAHR